MATTEEPVIPTEPAAELADRVVVAEETANDVNLPGKSTKSKKKASAPKEAKNKVPAPRKRGSSAHPPYFEMIKEAILALKERTGSSQYAIAKFVEDKQKNLPSNFRKILLVQLKKFVANEKLAKVKNSFKLPSARSVKSIVAPEAAKKKPAAAVKPKSKAAAIKEKKVVVAAKPKVAVKAKPAAKPKAATAVKAKSAPKRKATEPAKQPPAKVTRTSTRTNPGRKTATADASKKVSVAKKAVPVKKTPVKTVKPKTGKSPAKKAVGRKGKK